MTKLFKKVYFVLGGEYFRERARRRAGKLAELQRAEEQRERERAAAAAQEAAQRLARFREERRGELAEKEAQRKAADAAKREEAAQTIASRAAYMKWQEEINQRGPEDRPKVIPAEVTRRR